MKKLLIPVQWLHENIKFKFYFQKAWGIDFGVVILPLNKYNQYKFEINIGLMLIYGGIMFNFRFLKR